MVTQVNSNSPLTPFKFKNEYQTPEVLLNIFSYLPPEDLGRAVQVCRAWKNIGNDQKLWKTVLPKNHRDNFAPIVERKSLNWSQVPRYMKLSSFFEEVDNHRIDTFSEWNDGIAVMHDPTYYPTDSLKYGNTVFEIFQGTQIKAQESEEEPFFLEKLIQSQPGIINGDRITHLSIDGSFLFALWTNGEIDQWDINEREIVQTFSSAYDKGLYLPLMSFEPIVDKSGAFSVQNGYIFIKYNKSHKLEVIPYRDPSQAQIFNDFNLVDANKIILRNGCVYVLGRSIVTRYDLNKQQILKPIELSMDGFYQRLLHGQELYHFACDISIHDKRLLASGTNGKLKIFDSTSGKLLQTHKMSDFFDHSLLFEEFIFGLSGSLLEVIQVKNGKRIATLNNAIPLNKINPIALEWMVYVAKEQSNKPKESSQTENKVANCVTKIWQNVLEVASSCFV